MSIPTQLLVHTVTVEVLEGTGAYGDVFAAPVTVPCYVEQTAKMVRSSQGDEVMSQTQVFTDPPGTLIPRVPSGSRITLADGTKTTVISGQVFNDGGLTGLAHQEIDCE